MLCSKPVRALIVAVVPFLLLAACDGVDGRAAPSPISEPPPLLQTHPSASDGGTIRIRDVGFTVLGEDTTGSTEVAWAAVFENGSQTDLLAYVDFELRWRDTTGEHHTWPWYDNSQQRIYDIPPGRDAVVGGVRTTRGFVPESLDVSVNSDDWYPMHDLDSHGIPVGVEVTDFSIEVGNSVAVQAGYTSSYEGRKIPGDQDLRLLVILRDAAGALLGTVEAAAFGGPPPGRWDQLGSLRRSQWPDNADERASEVTIVKVCCSWVGVA